AGLEVEVGCGVLGVARVTDRTDELPACHKGAVGEARSDAPALAIVGSGGVVVEMDVPGHPATAMVDREMTAIRLGLAHPMEGAVGHGNHRLHLRGHDVNAFVATGTTVPACTEVLRQAVLTVDGEHHRVGVERGGLCLRC